MSRSPRRSSSHRPSKASAGESYLFNFAADTDEVAKSYAEEGLSHDEVPRFMHPSYRMREDSLATAASSSGSSSSESSVDEMKPVKRLSAKGKKGRSSSAKTAPRTTRKGKDAVSPPNEKISAAARSVDLRGSRIQRPSAGQRTTTIGEEEEEEGKATRERRSDSNANTFLPATREFIRVRIGVVPPFPLANSGKSLAGGSGDDYYSNRANEMNNKVSFVERLTRSRGFLNIKNFLLLNTRASTSAHDGESDNSTEANAKMSSLFVDYRDASEAGMEADLVQSWSGTYTRVPLRIPTNNIDGDYQSRSNIVPATFNINIVSGNAKGRPSTQSR